MNSDIELARDALKCIGGRIHEAAGEARIKRLGGMTNLVFRVDASDGRYCLRLPGKGTEVYIDRGVEAVNARAAAQAGVSPEVIHFGADGVMVTGFIDGAVTMSPAAFRERQGAVERAALAFRTLHDHAPEFSFRFELFRMIDDYLGVLGRLGD